MGVVPVHPHAEAGGLLGHARRVGQHALLAERDELGDAVVLDVALRGEAEVALDVDLDPQALAVEPVLVPLVLAEHRVEPLVEVLVRTAPGVMDAHRVVGGDRPVEEAPVGSARVLRSQPGERPALLPEAQDLVLLGDQVRLRIDRVEHSAPGFGMGRDPRSKGRWHDRFDGSEYPTRDATTAGGATAPPFPIRGRLPLPDLPGTRACVCRRLHARPGLRRAPGPARRPDGRVRPPHGPDPVDRAWC